MIMMPEFSFYVSYMLFSSAQLLYKWNISSRPTALSLLLKKHHLQRASLCSRNLAEDSILKETHVLFFHNINTANNKTNAYFA